MELRARVVFTRDYRKDDKSNQTVTCLDVEKRREFSITLQGVIIPPETFADLLPRAVVFSGVEFRSGDRGTYVVASGIHDDSAPRPEQSQQKAAK